MRNPFAKSSATHCRDRIIEHVHQRTLRIIRIQGANQFQIAKGRRIQNHVIAEIQNFKVRNVRKFGLLLIDQIPKDGSRHTDFFRLAIKAQRFHTRHFKMVLQNLCRLLKLVMFFVDGRHQNRFRPHKIGNGLRKFHSHRHKDFFRHAAGKFTFEILDRRFRYGKISRGDVSKSKCDRILERNDRAKVIGDLRVQVSFVHRSSCTDDFHDRAFDNSLGKLRIFDLFADGNFIASGDHLRKIPVRGMVRKSAKRRRARSPVVAARQGQAQNFGCDFGVRFEQFKEIAHAEKENAVGILGLDLVVLLH